MEIRVSPCNENPDAIKQTFDEATASIDFVLSKINAITFFTNLKCLKNLE